jgi:SAM-dependent methyltransferase
MSVQAGGDVFDSLAYKETTQEQRQAAAGAWHRFGPTLETWLGPATEIMLDLARIGPGNRVLDVAAGAGGQSIAAARRVGRTGSVLATDLSSNMLERAALAAQSTGFPNVATRVMDGENLEVEPGFFDVVISRLGLIYFPDPRRALASAHRALKPGGRIAAIVYTTAERNEFLSIPISIIRRRGHLPRPARNHPGPFSLGGRRVLERALAEAGFVEIETVVVPAALTLASAAEFVRFERESFGGLDQLLAGLAESEREELWAEVETELARFETPSGFEGPCELLVVGATRTPFQP